MVVRHHALLDARERSIEDRLGRGEETAPLAELHRLWDEVSWRICRERDHPDCADAEHAASCDCLGCSAWSTATVALGGTALVWARRAVA